MFFGITEISKIGFCFLSTVCAPSFRRSMLLVVLTCGILVLQLQVLQCSIHAYDTSGSLTNGK